MSPSTQPLPTGVLFGEFKQLNLRRKYQDVDSSSSSNDDEFRQPSKLRQALDFLFGFMLEDEIDETNDDELYRSMIEPSTPTWNPLDRWICLFLLLLSASDSVPVALAQCMQEEMDESYITSLTTATVLGTALGKLLLGPMVDVWGARRCLLCSTLLMCASQLLLAISTNYTIMAFTLVEFVYAMVWPAIVVLLATHYRGNAHGLYQQGIYYACMAGRLGSLVGLPVASLLLKHYHWRVVAITSAWMALISCSICFLHLSDAPDANHCPQNPIDPQRLRQFQQSHNYSSHIERGCSWMGLLFRHYQQSLRHVWGSGAFWLVSLAHTGASTVRTSERLVGTFLKDLNAELLTTEASTYSVALSLGILVGLVVVGHMFGHSSERQRKYLVTRGYLASIIACYGLSVTSLFPFTTTWLQLMNLFVVGVGIAVPLNVLPSIVGATFGCDKGLFASHVDGVGYALASCIWHVISQTSGWAYAWAAVALLLIVSGLAMSEFMEHYYCRRKDGAGTYETIIFA